MIWPRNTDSPTLTAGGFQLAESPIRSEFEAESAANGCGIDITESHTPADRGMNANEIRITETGTRAKAPDYIQAERWSQM